MANITRPPFPADHVGSLLRPAELRDARERFAAGEISAHSLRAAEDRCIRDVVQLQEDVGLQTVTDGEFRRTWWHFDFLGGFDGFEFGAPMASDTFKCSESRQPPTMRITGPITRTRPVMVDHFTYLNGLTDRTTKFTAPGPGTAHFRAGRAGIDETVYPELEDFWGDLTAAYRVELGDIAAHGCTYIQFDDISYAHLCDNEGRARLKSEGEDPDALALTYANALNEAIRDLPGDVVTATHMCRGTFQSACSTSGGYEAVAESVFNTVKVDALFMEYDSDRAGGFEPLRFMPKDKIVVLGLVATKAPGLESKDTLKRRIDEATRYIDIDRLRLSPQCGFSSTHHGNRITEADEIAKLRLVVDTAADIWG